VNDYGGDPHASDPQADVKEGVDESTDVRPTEAALSTRTTIVCSLYQRHQNTPPWARAQGGGRAGGPIKQSAREPGRNNVAACVGRHKEREARTEEARGQVVSPNRFFSGKKKFELSRGMKNGRAGGKAVERGAEASNVWPENRLGGPAMAYERKKILKAFCERVAESSGRRGGC